MRVLISDKLDDEGLRILEAAEGLDFDHKPGMSPEELETAIADYDGLIIRSGTTVTASVLERADKLKIIGRAGIGVDNIDVEAASKKGVIVENTPFGNSVTTAEHAISMMFAVSRKIPQATASMKEGKWEKNKFVGNEISGKTLGIIGAGNIGKLVIERALGLKMKVAAFDPFLTEEMAKKIGAEKVDLDQLFSKADYITIHTPVNDATRGLINQAAFKKMKQGVYLINCARGGIVVEKDLEWAIKEGIVKGAALDVFEKEPVDPEHPLLKMDEVICTPHLGASTGEAQLNVAIQVAEQMVDYLVNGGISNAVNFPSMTADLANTLKPYISLGEKMAKVLASVSNGALKTIEIEYCGEIAKYPTDAIKVSVLKGIFEPILEDVSVNYVNAPLIAKERGISVKETKCEESPSFTSQLKIRWEGESSHEVTGTIFGLDNPRIVRIDDYYLEAVPEGELLIIKNEDKPGVIGNIGSKLGANQVNISRMQLGLSKGKKDAFAIYNVSNNISSELLQEISTLPNILSVKKVSL